MRQFYLYSDVVCSTEMTAEYYISEFDLIKGTQYLTLMVNVRDVA